MISYQDTNLIRNRKKPKKFDSKTPPYGQHRHADSRNRQYALRFCRIACRAAREAAALAHRFVRAVSGLQSGGLQRRCHSPGRGGLRRTPAQSERHVRHHCWRTGGGVSESKPPRPIVGCTFARTLRLRSHRHALRLLCIVR